jgi:serine O-acetyltransferase
MPMKRSPAKPRPCTAGEPEYDICQTAKKLSTLFNLVETDGPDVLLTHSPAPKNIVDALRILLDVMFPGKISALPVAGPELGVFLIRRLSEGWRLLHREILRALPYRWIGEAARVEGIRPPQIDNLEQETQRILAAFLDTLPGVRKRLVADVQAAYDGDPAALTFAEVLLAYPGLLAIAAHRLAHELYLLQVPIIPRVMSEWIHTKTGTDIHPGARIGKAFFIDHATGVVIGETTEIGDHVKIYQGVTLGARSFNLDAEGHPVKHIKRHPTVENRVIIYANATILGGETVIGARSVIGSNVFLMESVPPGSVVSSNHPELHIRGSKSTSASH